MKIFVTGGSGILGTKLISYLKNTHEVYSPNRTECDVLDVQQITDNVIKLKPSIVIHLAAFVDTFGCEYDKNRALDINVCGTVNVVKACNKIGCKLVYISSEYVFSGEQGNYSVYDKLDPINIYGKTKAAAEYIASTADKYQIIRAPFIKKVHTEVFIDQYCTRYFLDDVVEKITNTILNNQSTLVQIAPQKDTLYNIYVKNGYKPKPIKMSNQQAKIIPKDTSLINESL